MLTASYGVNGFTPDMLDAFKQHGTQRVLIAYDRDEAGDRGAEAVAQTLTEAGIECWRVMFPHNMDANEYAQKVTPANKSLGLLIRKAEFIGAGKAPARPVIEHEATVRTEAAAPETETAPPLGLTTRRTAEEESSSLAAPDPARQCRRRRFPRRPAAISTRRSVKQKPC